MVVGFGIKFDGIIFLIGRAFPMNQFSIWCIVGLSLVTILVCKYWICQLQAETPQEFFLICVFTMALATKKRVLTCFLFSVYFLLPLNLMFSVSFLCWQLAQKELQKINMYKAPRDKLVCILNCCKVIGNLLLNASLASKENPPGADEFLPVLIYVTIKVISIFHNK